MNARALSQEAASWYLSHLDPSLPHSENVKSYLRGPVLALTLKILQSPLVPAGGLEIESKVPPSLEEEKKSSGETSGHWREYLQRKPLNGEDTVVVWNEQDQVAYDALGRRTKARLEAFLEGCSLAINQDNLTQRSNGSPSKNGGTASPTKPPPATDISLSQGLAGFNISKKEKPAGLLRQISTASSTSQNFPQFRASDIATRLELYIRSMNRVHTLGRECVIEAEPPRAMRARANAITTAFVATVGCVKSMSPSLTRLLHCLTKELLAVDSLSGEVCKLIRRLVMEYEHQTSFASLAFLSSPEVSAETRLTPMIMKYLGYLQKNWENAVFDCELERMLSTVLDSQMRHVFKTIEFRSIGHLLETCQGFRSELQNIELPPHMGGISSEDIESMCSDSKVVKQAIHDLKREVITINGNVLPPAKSYKGLIQLLSQTLNSKSLPEPSETRRKSRRRKNDIRRLQSCPADVSSPGEYSETSDSDIFFSSGNEGDTDVSPAKPRILDENPAKSRRRPRRGSRFQLNTVDMMTRRMMVASSRTGMGGDAYFIVKDLFGGEDVAVVPSNTMPTFGRMSRVGTIEIVVRLASLTIKCHGSFDVYPKALVGDCEPLIQLHTTTTEVIGLQEVRASDSSDEGAQNKDEDDSDDEDSSKFVLKEQQTEKTGWRTLSIRPALYEKVEVWNTPS